MNESELQQIKNYQKNQNIETELFFFHKYKNILVNTVYKIVISKYYFSHFLLQRDDMYAFVWLSLKNALIKFDPTREASIVSYLTAYVLFYVLREIRKYSNYSHRVLNAVELSACRETVHIPRNKDLEQNSRINQTDLQFESYVEQIIQQLKTCKQKNKIRKMLLMKNQGYSSSEIRKALGLSIPKYNYLRKLGKEAYWRIQEKNQTHSKK